MNFFGTFFKASRMVGQRREKEREKRGMAIRKNRRKWRGWMKGWLKQGGGKC